MACDEDLKSPKRPRIIARFRKLKYGLALVLFAALVGQCVRTKLDFKESLSSALQDADTIQIYMVKFDDKGQPNEFRHAITGKEDIQSFINMLDFDENAGWNYYGCIGDAQIVFSQGKKFLLSLDCLHGFGLRWNDCLWRADGVLTEDCQKAFPKWFASHGFIQFQELYDYRNAEAQKEKDEWNRFFSQFPDNVRNVIAEPLGKTSGDREKDEIRIGRQAAELMNDGSEIAVLAFKAFSESSFGWGGTSDKERRVIAFLSHTSDLDFMQALDRTKEDQSVLLGAAGFFFFWGYDKKFSDVDERNVWAVRLANVVIQQGRAENHPVVIRYLKKMNTPASNKFLHQIIDGEIIANVVESEMGIGDEPGIQASAALCLAQNGDKSIDALARNALTKTQTVSDKAAYEICLTLLGDPSFIRQEHFELESYCIGYAALQAIEKYNGVYGVDALVKGGLDHPWGGVREEAVIAFERITGKIFWKRTSFTPASRYSDDIKKWWAENGETFVFERAQSVQGRPVNRK